MERFSDKCEMSQFGKLNQDRICTVNDRTLENVVEQRDPGVQVHSSLNLATRVLRVVKTVWHGLLSSVRAPRSGVQKKFTRMLLGSEDLSYKGLERLGFLPLYNVYGHCSFSSSRESETRGQLQDTRIET